VISVDPCRYGLDAIMPREVSGMDGKQTIALCFLPKYPPDRLLSETIMLLKVGGQGEENPHLCFVSSNHRDFRITANMTGS